MGIEIFDKWLISLDHVTYYWCINTILLDTCCHTIHSYPLFINYGLGFMTLLFYIMGLVNGRCQQIPAYQKWMGCEIYILSISWGFVSPFLFYNCLEILLFEVYYFMSLEVPGCSWWKLWSCLVSSTTWQATRHTSYIRLRSYTIEKDIRSDVETVWKNSEFLPWNFTLRTLYSNV